MLKSTPRGAPEAAPASVSKIAASTEAAVAQAGVSLALLIGFSRPIIPPGQRLIGTTIGNYQVRELLGEGGMGKVYLALHPGIERKAAIKVLHPYLARDKQLVSRFFTEARASNAVHHPSIVDIYDYGTLPDGTPYIVMEYLDGRTLQAELREHRPAIIIALDWACQVAEALAAAHEKKIIHRDLKPENLFLTENPRVAGHKQVKILDFGIAKLQQNAEGQSHRTRTGVLMGTPLYMSPEQCLGVKEVDARSDVYSLGVILYEMVCGEPPFLSEGVGALINMHINQAPVPPRGHSPAISVALEAAILRALAKLPETRYPTMDEFLLDLQDELVAAGGGAEPGPPYKTPRPRPAPIAPRPLSAMTTLSRGVTIDRPPAATTVRVARRGWTIKVGGLALAVALAVVAGGQLFRTQTTAPGPDVEAIAPRPALAVPAPAAPAPMAEPVAPVAARAADVAPIEIGLDSEPAGATVTMGGVVVATTPALFKLPGVTATDEPATFEFALDGYRRETIRAQPSPGLKLKAKLRKLSPGKPASARPAGSAGKPKPAFDDIKDQR